VHIEPGPVERERSGEAADPAPDDPHRKHILHVTNDTPDSGITHRRGGDDVALERATCPPGLVLCFASSAER
jgi:hypothetical protein